MGIYSLLLPLANLKLAHVELQLNDPRKEFFSDTRSRTQTASNASGALEEFPYQVLSTIRAYKRERISQGKNKLVVFPARQTTEMHKKSFLKFQKTWISDGSEEDGI